MPLPAAVSRSLIWATVPLTVTVPVPLPESIETPLSPAIAGRLVAEFRSSQLVRTVSVKEPEGRALSRREIEILQLVADGLGNKEIGARLSITEGTVKNHVHNALEKLHLENRTQAAGWVVRQGLGHRPADAG